LGNHRERVGDLTEKECVSLHPCIGRVTAALDGLFAPDLYAFAFLMNYDAHVLLHVVPCCYSPREWRRTTYTDPHYGSLLGKGQRPASEVALDELAAVLKQRL